jgi:hypothetical protein
MELLQRQRFRDSDQRWGNGHVMISIETPKKCLKKLRQGISRRGEYFSCRELSITIYICIIEYKLFYKVQFVAMMKDAFD